MSAGRPSNPRRVIFDALAPAWDSICALTNEQAETLRGILTRLAIPRGAAFLDVGCGTGVLVPYVLPLIGEGGRYVGLDVSELMTAEAARKCSDPRASFVAEDLYDFAPGSLLFDTAIVFSAFPHLHDKPAALAAFSRLVKARGRLCIAHVESSRAINAYHEGRVTNEVLKNDHLPSIEEMRNIIDESLWSIVEAEDREGLYLLILERKNGVVL